MAVKKLISVAKGSTLSPQFSMKWKGDTEIRNMALSFFGWKPKTQFHVVLYLPLIHGFLLLNLSWPSGDDSPPDSGCDIFRDTPSSCLYMMTTDLLISTPQRPAPAPLLRGRDWGFLSVSWEMLNWLLMNICQRSQTHFRFKITSISSLICVWISLMGGSIHAMACLWRSEERQLEGVGSFLPPYRS